MWKSIKSYFQFCAKAIQDHAKQTRYGKMLMTFRKISRTLERLLSFFLPVGAGFALLYLFYQYISGYASKRTWAIVFVSLFCAFLLFLIGIIRGFYERTVERYEERMDKIKEKYESDIREWQTTLEFSKRLYGPEWMGSRFIEYLDDDFKIPQRLLERWSGHACQAMNHVVGTDSDAMSKFYEGIPPTKNMWESIPDQMEWVKRHTMSLAKQGMRLLEYRKSLSALPKYDSIDNKK